MNLLFRRHSFLVAHISGYLLYITIKQARYCDLMRTYNLFAARVLYIIDVRIHNFSDPLNKESSR